MFTSYLGIYLLVGAFFGIVFSLLNYQRRSYKDTWASFIGEALFATFLWPLVLWVSAACFLDKPLPRRREKE